MSEIFKNVVYPFWHWIKRDGVNAAIADAENVQWLSADELLELQQLKLRRLLSFAGEKVPYYRRKFGPQKFEHDRPVLFESLGAIAPLTKHDIRDNPRSLIRADEADRIRLNNSTSGSTGEALQFHTDWRSRRSRKASSLRSDSWTGWRLGEKIVRLWGAPIDHKLSRGIRGKVHGWVTRDRFLSSFDLSPSKLEEYARQIIEFRPVLIVAYPGPLEQLAIHCSDRGIRFPSLKAIVSSAETLWPYQRETIEETFGVKIFDRYGSREVGLIGSECEEHDGLHISVDRLLVEVVDEHGRQCKAGEEGRLLVTDLENYGMPLIRYEIGDRGVWGGSEPCACGRGLPRLKTVVGRTMDIVRTPSGRQLGGTFWTLLLKSRPGLWQIQVIQEDVNGVVINFVRDKNFDPGVLEYFKGRIREYCGDDFGVIFVEKQSIDVTKSGKRRIIISNLESRA